MPKVSTRNDVVRPMNVVVARGSRAEEHFRALAALPGAAKPSADVLAAGLRRTPAHNLKFHGGKTIRDLTFTNIYLGGASSWNATDMTNIDQALAAAMSDQGLNNVMMQYFANQSISSTFKTSQVLPGSKPLQFSQGDVELLVGQLQAQGKFSGLSLNSTVINLLLPSGTVLNTDAAQTHVELRAAAVNPAHPEDDATSLQGLGGYHGSVHVNNQVTVYYAVGVYSERSQNGTDNGIVAFDQPWKNVVATFYHELCEARTDPDVEDAIRAGNDPNGEKFLGWMSTQGEECGDFPMFEVGNNLSLVMKEIPLADGSGTVPVQFQYSNSVAGPEGPIQAPHTKPAH
jgi:hypothetical protein